MLCWLVKSALACSKIASASDWDISVTLATTSSLLLLSSISCFTSLVFSLVSSSLSLVFSILSSTFLPIPNNLLKKFTTLLNSHTIPSIIFLNKFTIVLPISANDTSVDKAKEAVSLKDSVLISNLLNLILTNSKF